ncbi:hypothetical protein BG004_006306 [Podila humilis]|nr:hypothetical protein BG004_006306 [Podila humilis]
MASYSNSFSQKSRAGSKDEPEDLRQLRQEHGGSLATLKELFADWTEEDLLYAIQESGGDLETTIVRISDGHATQWGEVKGKKKTPKPKSAPEKQEFRSSNNQRGGFTARGRGDATRGGRGGATRGAPRAQNGSDRNGRPYKSEQETAVASDTSAADPWATKADTTTSTTDSLAEASVEATPSWATSNNDTATSSNDTPSWATETTTSTTDSWATPATTVPAADAWSAPAAAAPATDSWGAPAAAPAAAPVRKLNTATIPAGSKMSWAKIVKPNPPPAPVVVPAPAPVVAAPVHIPAAEPEPVKAAEPVIAETAPAVAVIEEEDKKEEEVVEPAVAESELVEEEIEEPVAAREATPEPEAAVDSEVIPAAESSPTNVTPVGPPGLKTKAATQTRRLNQDAPVVMPSGLSALQSVGVKFGSFSLNDEAETVEPEVAAPAPTQPAVQAEQPQQAAAAATAPAPAPAAAAPAPAPAAPAPAATTPAQTASQPTYGRQPSAPAVASGYQGAAPAAASGLSPAVANANASYMKQDPAVNYLGQQHHHHPGMGHDAMGSPYGSYMPNPANQLGSFGMGPMASLPNDYAALYGNDIQRAMYYDPTSYGQIPVTAGNNYQSRDGMYNQETSTASTSGATSTGSTQAHQSLQQQQQQQQAYPNIAGGMPYYPYYYMPNQFPNAYQQSGYGQPFVNKNMYPMYQHQQQHNTNKPGAGNNTPYGSYSSTGAQSHHQYSQSGYEDMSGAGIHGMGGLNNDPYAKYGNPGMQNFMGNQQQPATPTSGANNTKGNTGANQYSSGADKTAAAGSQSSNNSQMTGGASALQNQQPGNVNNQGQQGYYQQQMFSNYQYQGHHQGYHPNQHQGQHQGTGRNQQFWGAQN